MVLYLKISEVKMQFPSGIYFDVQIGDYKGFIQLHDVLTFELIETTGVEFPEVEVCFQTTSTKIKDMVIQNNPIKILLGESNSDYDIIEVSVLEKDVKSLRMDTYSCYFKGYTGDIRFILDKIQKGINNDPLNGIIEVCDIFSTKYNSNLSVESEIDSSTELSSQKMNWLAIDETYRQLIVDMWSHMDIRPSFPLMAINRYNKLLMKDFNNLIANEVKWNFIQNNPIDKKSNELTFSNSFLTENNTEVYNLYAGHGKAVNIYDNKNGNYNVNLHNPKPLLGASQELDISKAGSRTLQGYRKSSNTHTNYHEAYMHNVSRLMALSNISGYVDFPNMYNKNLNLLDQVNLTLADTEKGRPLSGKYIVHTIVYNFSSVLPFLTRVYIGRDCNNNIEDNILKNNNGIKIPTITKESILQNAKLARTLLTYIRSYINGTLYNEIIDYFSSLKSNVLSSFSIQGTTIDLNSQTTAVNSIHNLGSNIFYKLINLYIPVDIQYLYKSQDWSDNPNLLDLLNSTIQVYSPQEISSLYQELLLTINDINLKIKGIDNQIIAESGVEIQMIPSTDPTSSSRVDTMINSMLNNVQELNIPVPIVSLTESEQLLNDNKLESFIADSIINNLQSQGYLEGFSDSDTSVEVLSINNFKNILLGITVIDTLTISTINSNVSSVLYHRYWGTFNNLDELTDYSIKKGFQDYFSSPNCSKIITALGGKRLYVVLPSSLKNIAFKINNNIYSMDSAPMDMLIFNDEGNKIPYTVYYTSDSSLYNSSNVTVEIIK